MPTFCCSGKDCLLTVGTGHFSLLLASAILPSFKVQPHRLPCFSWLLCFPISSPSSALLLSISLAEPFVYLLLLGVDFLVCMFTSRLDTKTLASLTLLNTEQACNKLFLIRLYIHYISVKFVSMGYIPTWKKTAAPWPIYKSDISSECCDVLQKQENKCQICLLAFLIFLPSWLCTSEDRKNWMFHDCLELSMKGTSHVTLGW